jgi:hypothetical protein
VGITGDVVEVHKKKNGGEIDYEKDDDSFDEFAGTLAGDECCCQAGGSSFLQGPLALSNTNA